MSIHLSASEIAQAQSRFRALYGAEAVAALRAPARINILGEHVDYVSYLPTASLPFGSREHAMCLWWRASDDGCVSGASLDERFAPFRCALAEEGFAGQNWESFVFGRPLPAPHWRNYVNGAVQFARWKYGAQLTRGLQFLLTSTIPPNSGASSSSALVVLAGAAIRQANGISYELAELAADSAQAEWYLGTRGGALDHTGICLARAGHAVHISHTDKQATLVPLPGESFRWLTFFSHPADKGRAVMLAYNERAAVARLLIPAVLAPGAALEAAVEALPESLSLADIAQTHPAVFQECQRVFPALVSERQIAPLKLRDRARHHVSETKRVAIAVQTLNQAISTTDALRTLGRLLNDAHASLRDLYDVSTPEVETLRDVICADEHVFGARLMGGGFGGNVLALTSAGNVSTLTERVQQEFYAPRGRNGVDEGSVMISTPGEGLSDVVL